MVGEQLAQLPLYYSLAMNDVDQALSALEALASEPGTSASGPIQSLLDKHFATAREQLQSGSDPTQVIQDLIKAVAKSKKEVEKGLKGWYNGLGIVGKAVEKVSSAEWPERTSKELTCRPSRQTSLASLMLTMIPRSSLSQTQQERWIGWC